MRYTKHNVVNASEKIHYELSIFFLKIEDSTAVWAGNNIIRADNIRINFVIQSDRSEERRVGKEC